MCDYRLSSIGIDCRYQSINWHRLSSIININRLIGIDCHRMPSIPIDHRFHRLGTPWPIYDYEVAGKKDPGEIRDTVDKWNTFHKVRTIVDLSALAWCVYNLVYNWSTLLIGFTNDKIEWRTDHRMDWSSKFWSILKVNIALRFFRFHMLCEE